MKRTSIEDLVTVRRSAKAKRVALRLDPQERVMTLVVPTRMPLQKAYFFAQTHEDWVRETLSKLSPPIAFTHQTTLPLFGEKYTILIDRNPAYKRTTVTRHNAFLKVTTNLEDPSGRIKFFIKKMAHEGISDIASEKAESINKKIKTINMRDTKSRWGSCAKDGTLSFSWRLIFAPYEVTDYVIAHEVAHLKHMNHGPKFWALCEDLCLNYDFGKNWLKQNGNELMRYGRS